MSKCDYCDNTNSCQTCGLTYDDGVKDGRAQAIKELVNAMERRNRPVPADRLVRGVIIYAVDVLERKFADDMTDMTSSHSESDVYKGCLDLMEKMVEYFYEYVEFIGYDVEKEDPDERFSISFMPTEIIRKLFLSGTGHDGGTSCRMKCRELGIEEDKPVKFDFGKYKETDPEKCCDNCGQPRNHRGKCIPYDKGECKPRYSAWIPKEMEDKA